MNIRACFYLLLLLFFSCQEEEEKTITNLITIPQEISQLGIISGNLNEDVTHILINTQGGPVNELLDNELSYILSLTDQNIIKDFLIMNVHQAQTFNPEFFNANISFDQAKTFDQQSVDDLAKVIQFFKSKNKKVHVLGISFGAFITQELIAKYNADIADDYLIFVGRLDMPEIIWKSFSEGNVGGFVDGITPFAAPASGGPVERNMNRLAAGLGHKRYTVTLADQNLEKVVYVYGELDQQVGRLSTAEIDFLTSHGASVIKMTGADHSEAINRSFNEQFKTAFGF